MSSITRSLGCTRDTFGGYKDSLCCPMYGDTDSLIFHSQARIHGVGDNLWGNKLGELKNEFPGGKIIEAYFISPKVYALRIWFKDNEKGIIEKWHIRCKGIKQDTDPMTCCDSPEKFEKYQKVKPTDILYDLKECIYSLYDSDGKHLYSYKVIPFFYFKLMATQDCYMVCNYGSILKDLVDVHGRGASVKLDMSLHRTINHPDKRWWDEGKRVIHRMVAPYGISYPKGHYLYNINKPI